ncbi:hypothetical protein ABZW96_37150 [Nocardia sp. NPDC004168]|uniref:hypothetical protein n=1 Tax=Nocardia sp. NPDC004168 TaxID=3154452 RepID=UPI0033AA9E39
MSRLRRRILRLLVVTVVLAVFPGVLGAVATAQGGATTSAGRPGIAALEWTNIRDSSGARLTDYFFATSHGSLLNPLETVVSAVIVLEFIGYMVLVTAAIWAIGYAISYQWLDPFGRALTGVAESLTGQIATPLLLTTSVAIGAFFVGWFVVRGYHAKAMSQVVTMVAIAVLGPLFLAEPLADVLSANGLLAQGRDLGISVAAGLNGQTNPNPGQLVPSLQAGLADNFARRPVQVWNFGHTLDQSPQCNAAWTAGIRSGDESRVLNGLAACGDSSAQAEARHPGMGQIGSGLVLLVCGTAVLIFAVHLGFKIIKSALDTIYHGFMAIFGFASGGFVYGPTQSFLVRNIVDGFVAAARMTIYTIFLGVYVLFLDNLFKQAGNQVMAVIVIACIVEFIAISQLKQLSAGLSRGNEWIANRFSLAIQGSRTGGAGSTSGMGTAFTARSLPSTDGPSALGRIVTTAAIMQTLNTTPLAGWIFGRKNPLDKDSKKRNEAEVDGWQLTTSKIGGMKVSGRGGLAAGLYADRAVLAKSAQRGLHESIAAGHGGVNTHRGAAAAVDEVLRSGGSLPQAYHALMGAGFTDERLISDAIEAHGMILQMKEDETLTDNNLNKLIAGAILADAKTTPARVAALERAALNYRSVNSEHVALRGTERDHTTPSGVVHDYMSNPTKEKLKQIQKVADGEIGESEASYSRNEAARMLRRISFEHSNRISNAVGEYVADTGNPDFARSLKSELSAALDTDRWASGVSRTPTNSLAPPS